MAEQQMAYPEDAEEHASALEEAVYAQPSPPTVATIANELGWPAPGRG
jgi:hypothetical protein